MSRRRRRHRRSPSRRAWLFGGSAALALALVAGWWAWSSGSGDDAALRRRLAGEMTTSEPAPTGRVVEVSLVAAPASLDLVDAGPTDVWAYNGSVPGPELRAEVGDTLRVEFRNELPAATTLHWHGVRVPNAFDGVPDVTQAAVMPGERQTYEFTLRDAGTYWYHTHVDGSEQLERGLYGALVVEDPAEPRWARDIVWVIDDWLLGDDGRIDPGFSSLHDIEHNGRWGTFATVNSSPDEVLRLAPGERIRLRLVNASNARVYAPEFGGLTPDLVAVDGHLTRATHPAGRFALAPGNRVDLDLVAPDTPGRFEVVDHLEDETLHLATIEVVGDPVVTPDFDAPVDGGVPTWADSADVSVDRDYRFALRRSAAGVEWTINSLAYPQLDPLIVGAGEFVKLRLVNDSEMLHPMHLHGQVFKVLSRDGEPVDEGHLRDTVLVFAGETLEIGFVATEPGTWAFHCHTMEHADAGMVTAVVVEPA